MSGRNAVIRQRDEGELWWFGGGLLSIKVTDRESDGSLFVFEDTAPKAKTTPLHVHPGHDETFYIIEGEMLFHVDGDELSAGPGGVAFVPRGVPHAFLVTSEFTRWVAIITPGDGEAFVREGGEAAPVAEPPPPGSLDIPRLKAAGERTGFMKVLGPPPFAMGEGAVASTA